MSRLSHIVEAGPQSFVCGHCGGRFDSPHSPDMHALRRASNAWATLHADCRPGDPAPVKMPCVAEREMVGTTWRGPGIAKGKPS